MKIRPEPTVPKLIDLANQLDAIAERVQGVLLNAGKIEELADVASRAQVQAAKVVVEAFDQGSRAIAPFVDSVRKGMPSHLRNPDTGAISNSGYQQLWFYICAFNQPKNRQPPLMPEDKASEEARCRHHAASLVDVCHEIARKLGPDREARLSSPPSPDFVPTHRQTAILEALDGKMLLGKELIEKLGCDRRTLYSSHRTSKTGGLTELTKLGRVKNKRGGGYYRPDAPPPGSH